jgi:hypothetical protein
VKRLLVVGLRALALECDSSLFVFGQFLAINARLLDSKPIAAENAESAEDPIATDSKKD